LISNDQKSFDPTTINQAISRSINQFGNKTKPAKAVSLIAFSRERLKSLGAIIGVTMFNF